MSSLRPWPAILPLLLLGAGMFMLLSALVLQPAAGGHGEPAAAVTGDHGVSETAVGGHAEAPAGAPVDDHAEAAAAATVDDHAEEPAAAGHAADHATAAPDDHAVAPAEDGHATATTDDHGEEGVAAGTDAAHGDEHEESAGTFLGIDLDEINMVSPRLALIAIALSLLLGVVLMVRRDPAVLLATAILALAMAVVEAREALLADEELGIVVPLPVLAVILHVAAATLALLALAAQRAPAAAAHQAPAHGHPA